MTRRNSTRAESGSAGIQLGVTNEQIEQQLARLDGQQFMDGFYRLPALRWLIDFQRRGMYRPKQLRTLSAVNFFTEFYAHVGVSFANPSPNDAQAQEDRKQMIVDRGKGLFGDLARALKAYYGGPGVNDPVKITLKRGHGCFFEPCFELNVTTSAPAPRTETREHDNPVITDIELISVEAKTPEGSEIWVAAPDLSNVGDETSPYSELLRKTVRDNARRGISYTYICPNGHAGQSRIENLRECFTQTTGKLHLHQIPPERFCEITLVQAHFISFNPLSEAPDAYMQLPVSQAQKGWIKLNRNDAGRVLAKMKSLRAAYPEDAIAPAKKFSSR